MSTLRTIAEVLAAARTRLTRLTPDQAFWASTTGAVVVDIRPAAQRAAEGELPGALVIERNVLEWRFDPSSDARLEIADHDLPVIVLCSEGYTSSLAAAALQELGGLHVEPRGGRAAGARGLAGHRRGRWIHGLATVRRAAAGGSVSPCRIA